MRTVSPTFAEFSSSWAFRRLVRVTILPYTGCGTRRSIATTTVFCILSLTTRPVRVFRAFRRVGCSLVISAMVSSPRSTRALELALAQDGLQPRDVLPDPPQPQRVVQRLRRAAKAQAESLLFQARDPRADLVHRQFPNLVSLHRCAPPREQRTSSSPASSPRRVPWPSARCRGSRLPARTSRGPASPPPPTSPGSPCPSPCGFRPAS